MHPHPLPRWPALVVLAFCSVCLSCGSNGPQPAAIAESPEEEKFLREYKTPQEREYAKLAMRFAQALVKDDFSAARAAGSRHLKSDLTIEQLETAEKKSREIFGAPLRIFPGRSVNTSPIELAGPNQKWIGENPLDASLRKMSASRAVGEMPDSIPRDIRKASVELEIERDPSSIPDFQEQTGLNPDDVTAEDRVISYLTVVLVEENETLGVAHFFYRWPDNWDNPPSEASSPQRQNGAPGGQREPEQHGDARP